MMRRPKYVFALLAGIGFLGACDSNDIDPMMRQKKYRAYAESEVYADGRAMRLPPDGTVSRETVVDPAIGQGLAADGKPVDRIPVPVTMDLLERGRNRFDIYCAVCHGLAADGVSVVATKMGLRTPPSLHTDVIRALTPGRIFRVITDGYGLMTPYKAELSVPDRWAVVAYVKALQLSQHAKVTDAPPDEQQKLQAEPEKQP